MSKKCTKCGVMKEEPEFNKSSRNKSGLRSECKECQKKAYSTYRLENYDKELTRCRAKDKRYIANGKRKEWTKRWKSSEKGKEWVKAYDKKYKSSDRGRELNAIAAKKRRATPEYKAKDKCWNLAQYAITKGILVREPCVICGEMKVEAHHEDYFKPLEVKWLCAKHHRDRHKK